MAWIDNPRWDAAIEADPDVAIGTGFPGRRASARRRCSTGPASSSSSANCGRPTATRSSMSCNAAARSRSNSPRATGVTPNGPRRHPNWAAARLPAPPRPARSAPRRPRGGYPRSRVHQPEHVIAGCPQRHGGDTEPDPGVRPWSRSRRTGRGSERPRGRPRHRDRPTAAVPVPGRDPPGPQDHDPIATLPSGEYAVAVGHGTLVAGVIARYSPAATRVVRRVLETPGGMADESEVAWALRQLPPNLKILNASFSGFSVINATPLP